MDLKGRVTVPSKFREDLGDRFFVCRAIENCLYVFSPSQMEEFEKRISEFPMVQQDKLRRYFFSGAGEVEPDKQGRILIPQKLREHAGITKEVTVIGVGDKAEIWATENWNAYNDAQTSDSIADIMSILGGKV